MERTRAERRYKTALIKKRLWNKGYWKDNIEQETIYSRSQHAYIPITNEYIKRQYRYAYRNEGKWRHAGMKKFYGCGPDCWYCNPQIRCEWREKSICAAINKLDYADFIEALS